MLQNRTFQMTRSKWLYFLLLPCLFWSCHNIVDEKESIFKENEVFTFDALPSEVIYPEDNKYTKEKEELGKLLFFDPILSGNNDVACATCHHPEFGFAESLELSMGVNAKGLGSKRRFIDDKQNTLVKRNSQTVLNSAYNGIDQNLNYDPINAPMFWDLRAKSLESQALEPIKTLEEMKGTHFKAEEILNIVIEKLKKNSEYQLLFNKAFGADSITAENLSKALATYERSLITPNSRFDAYMRGDKSVLSHNEIEGMAAFVKSGCINCHHGPMLSDFESHTLGVPDNVKLGYSDTGIEGNYSFRTPSLRNLRFTFPYMHNGTFKTLRNVLEFYEDLSGGIVKNSLVKEDQLDPKIKKLKVNFKDLSLIEEFLGTLNDDNFDKTLPQKVPSGLEVGGALK